MKANLQNIISLKQTSYINERNISPDLNLKTQTDSFSKDSYSPNFGITPKAGDLVVKTAKKMKKENLLPEEFEKIRQKFKKHNQKPKKSSKK